MSTERQAWIVGSIEWGTQAGDQRFHRSDCYVLDQGPNRGDVQKVRLADLPDIFRPCGHCAPARRSKDITDFGAAPVPEPIGVRPGHTVEVENVETGKISSIRLLRMGDTAAQGSISPRSPIAAALIGKSAGDVAEVSPPKGGSRRLRVLSFRSQSE